MRFLEIINEAELQIFYHGTLASKVPSILKHGLQPSSAGEAEGRWATLGGVYLTTSFEYAVKAAKATTDDYDAEPIAVVGVHMTSTKNTTADEDVIEKVLVKAFTSTLDGFGVDDAYEGNLDRYADDEEVRPPEYEDDEPFDRQKFFADFWAAVMQQMSTLAGTPRRRNPALIQQAVGIALEIVDTDADATDHWSARRWQEWQAIKIELTALYPRLRSAEQHAKSGVTIAHNIRVTKLIPSRQIASVVQQSGNGWKTIFQRD